MKNQTWKTTCPSFSSDEPLLRHDTTSTIARFGHGVDNIGYWMAADLFAFRDVELHYTKYEISYFTVTHCQQGSSLAVC